MAERRMFSKSIIGSARFLRMPQSSRLLYYDLGMDADDDGVVEAFTVMRKTGANEDDLRILVGRNFVKVLNDDLVSYIMDWSRNNLIKNDRHHPSVYQHLLLKLTDGSKMVPLGFQDGSILEPESSLGKSSLDKVSLDQSSQGQSNIEADWQRAHQAQIDNEKKSCKKSNNIPYKKSTPEIIDQNPEIREQRIESKDQKSGQSVSPAAEPTPNIRPEIKTAVDLDEYFSNAFSYAGASEFDIVRSLVKKNGIDNVIQAIDIAKRKNTESHIDHPGKYISRILENGLKSKAVGTPQSYFGDPEYYKQHGGEW